MTGTNLTGTNLAGTNLTGAEQAMRNRMQHHRPAMPEASLLLTASQLYAIYI
ncbi:pentapeptide repeat-containing protein [Paenibacillus dendritiformis]|uniref:pentapeptide repeat-containing protein n=1 Tax=Paenibacillus dendritiformis TaxID=130049 RepID=UPI003CCFD12E